MYHDWIVKAHTAWVNPHSSAQICCDWVIDQPTLGPCVSKEIELDLLEGGVESRHQD